MTSVAANLNRLGMLKALTSGSVSWLLFDIKSRTAAIYQVDCIDQISIDELTKKVEKLDASGLATLVEKGAKAFFVKQNANEILSIQARWIAAESAVTGILLYSVRKTFLPVFASAVDNYAALIGTHSITGKGVTKMQEAI